MGYQNIVLIDDDSEDQEIFKNAIEQVSEKIDCSVFSNGKEALRMLQSNDTGRPDLIFLDLNMPVMSGQEFLKERLKNDELTKIPVIVFSTSSNTETIALTKNLGAKDFITKPDRFDKLVTLLEGIFN